MSEQQTEEAEQTGQTGKAEAAEDLDQGRADDDRAGHQDDDGGGSEAEKSDPEEYQPTSDLPEPKVDPPPPPPGGPDAVPGVGGVAGNGPSVPADPDPDKNPQTDNELPAETTEPDDTDTQATRGATTEPEKESPA